MMNIPPDNKLVHTELRRDSTVKKFYWHKSGRERSWASQYFKTPAEAEQARRDGAIVWQRQG